MGNPANTNAYIVSHYAPSLDKRNFTALTRLDDNRARSLLAGKLGVPLDSVDRTIIWGNHSNTQYPDLEHVQVKMADGNSLNGSEVIDRIGLDYYHQEYIKVRRDFIIN